MGCLFCLCPHPECEYCLIAETDRVSGCHVDHIISAKHGGATTADNLACACTFCNLQKGSDLGSIVWRTGELVRFFHPRRDAWHTHFRLEGSMIQPVELATISQTLGDGTAFLNEDFTRDNLFAQHQTLVYPILHLATHADFQAGTPRNSYIQLFAKIGCYTAWQQRFGEW
ncbi:MAG TPA: HNH endonuclease [Oscillatoriales cyanobacterium M4454_W2019_049]|nr:HNH endonuclease [Oscillatoriales cyanobacterium M4454_W2019_049]